MIIELDGGIVRMQPDTINWTPPRELGLDSQGAPVYAPYWQCTLGFSRLTKVEFDRWFNAVDGTTHTVRMPHPITGEMTDFTCYVWHVAPRLNTRNKCIAAVSGADIQLTRITVT